MILTKLKYYIQLYVGVGVIGLFVIGCGSDNNHRTIVTPDTNQRAVITVDNTDKVLATTVGGVGKIAHLLDGVVEQLPSVGTNNRAISDFDLTTRDCASGGSLSVDKVTSSGGIITFNECNEQDTILDGTVEIDTNGLTYDAIFSEFRASSKGDDIYLSSATAHIVDDDYEFFILSGISNVKGEKVEAANFELNKIDQLAVANGSLRTTCVGAWVDIATIRPLLYSENDNLIDGEVSIVGENSNLQVDINSNSTVTVMLNGQLYREYNSVEDLPKYSEVCQ